MIEHIRRNSEKNNHHRMSDVKLSPLPKIESATHEVRAHSTRSFDTYEQNYNPAGAFLRSLVIFLLLLGLALFFGARLFGRAHTTVTSHTLSGPLDIVLNFGTDTGNQTYETMTLSREKVQQVLIEDIVTQEQRSSGTLVIFNEEPREQRFREETRFETPDGLIFMLGKGEGVIVPAAQGSKPGSVEVTVYAEKTGEKYNIGPSDFVIPGWREINDNRFTTQYARSQSAMSQGGSGPTPVISQELREKITTEMQASLREQMIAQAWVDAPDEFIFFEDMVDIQFGPLTLSAPEDESLSATASIQGTLSTVLFHHDDLAKIFAQEISTTYQGEQIRIDNPSALQATLSPHSTSLLGWGTRLTPTSRQSTVVHENQVKRDISENATTDMSDNPLATSQQSVTTDTQFTSTNPEEASPQGTISVHFLGTIAMTMYVERERLLEEMEHMPKKDIVEYFSSIPEIQSAKVSIQPFWRIRIPQRNHNTLIINPNTV